MSRRDLLLLRALRREPTPRAPVWLMRQAGRYLPEYRAARAQAGGFLELAKDPALAAEVTLQPVRRFGVDAAILFSDILLPLEAMGMQLHFDSRGPLLPRPVRGPADVERLRPIDPRAQLGFVGEALARTREELPEGTALLGFCGAPFTLAAYAVEGGTSREFAELRRMMYHQGALFTALLDALAETAIRHLRFQVENGADAVVVFDTWAGTLGREDWLRFAAPWMRRVLAAVDAPRIAFAGTSDHLLEDLAELGADALVVDHRTPIGAAFERVGARVALQGNLDPAALLAPPAEVERRARAILEQVGGRPGHLLALSHGVLKWTDPACVAAFVGAAGGR
jgi:uroporphyrinogen decarboxylase